MNGKKSAGMCSQFHASKRSFIFHRCLKSRGLSPLFEFPSVPVILLHSLRRRRSQQTQSKPPRCSHALTYKLSPPARPQPPTAPLPPTATLVPPDLTASGSQIPVECSCKAFWSVKVIVHSTYGRHTRLQVFMEDRARILRYRSAIFLV